MTIHEIIKINKTKNIVRQNAEARNLQFVKYVLFR